jgi:RNA polymerase sigma factor (sigma-70 family)
MDDAPLTDEQRRLAEDNVDLARQLAHWRRRSLPWWVSYDEVHSEALYALVLAARRFDAAKGASFRSYAARRILGNINDWLTYRLRARRYAPTCSLDEDRDAAALVDGLPDGSDGVGERLMAEEERRARSAALCGLLARLNRTDREIVRLHVYGGLKLREVAALMGRSTNSVTTTHGRAMNKLRVMAKGVE